MGLVKTIYNVLGGFYMDYNSTNLIISVHKLNKSLQYFLCTFSSPILIISIFTQKIHKKTRFFDLVFVFRLLWKRFQGINPQILLWRFFLFLKEDLHNALKHLYVLK